MDGHEGAGGGGSTATTGVRPAASSHHANALLVSNLWGPPKVGRRAGGAEASSEAGQGYRVIRHFRENAGSWWNSRGYW